MKLSLGSSLPPSDPHGVSVYLPTWKDTIGWASRNPEVVSRMKVGYPRFFIPRIVIDLAGRLIKLAASEFSDAEVPDKTRQFLATPELSALLFSSERLATLCETYFSKVSEGSSKKFLGIHVTFDGKVTFRNQDPAPGKSTSYTDLFAVIYSPELTVEARAIWQHSGFGISTRCASYWLENAPFIRSGQSNGDKTILPIEEATRAGHVLRKRIASLASTGSCSVGEESVLLYPTGMSSITHTITALRALRSHKVNLRVAVYGFLYVDTQKILSKVYGFDFAMYGHANQADLDRLEQDLIDGLDLDALYTEMPGNPLLIAPDLGRLYDLSRKYNFLLIVDDTIGTSANLDIILSCDIICTSLTKLFSGACNVMGGSITLNPQSRYYSSLADKLAEQYVDTYFPQDVMIMEKNSRDFAQRVATASQRAERIVEVLRAHPSVTRVYYPRGNPSQYLYDQYRRPDRGYGFLLSITFQKPEAAIAFHDALDVAKGPSLGTNFTLCCAYTLFAHYRELDYAAKYGLVEHLVRISVGIEDEVVLMELVQTALNAAAEKCL